MITRFPPAQQNIAEASSIDGKIKPKQTTSLAIKRIRSENPEQDPTTKKFRFHLDRLTMMEYLRSEQTNIASENKYERPITRSMATKKIRTHEELFSLFLTEPEFGIRIEDFVEITISPDSKAN